MTIAILKLEVGQKIARPFARACDWQEARELLARDRVFNARRAAGDGYSAALNYAEKNWTVLADEMVFLNLDTENPVYERAGVSFYAFIEA